MSASMLMRQAFVPLGFVYVHGGSLLVDGFAGDLAHFIVGMAPMRAITGHRVIDTPNFLKCNPQPFDLGLNLDAVPVVRRPRHFLIFRAGSIGIGLCVADHFVD